MDHYKFPHIHHIDQVLKAIKGCDDFYVAERDRHSIVNYMVNSNSTFPRVCGEWNKLCRPPEDYVPVEDTDMAIRRECRGIVFGPTGTVIARRLHKFFNIGEREETFTEDVDFKKPHVVIDKLDGSMITPIPIYRSAECVGKGMYTLRWGTKMGITAVAMQAEEFVADRTEYSKFANECIYYDMTPIFEWCSRKQRIVVDYPRDTLKLIAIRQNINGEYIPYENMWEMARIHKIPCVGILGDDFITDPEEFIAEVRAMEDVEGFVIRFEDGHMLKVKGDWYCRIHRAKDSILQEKRVLEIIVNDKADDVKPFLLDHDLKAFCEYEEAVLRGLVRESILISCAAKIWYATTAGSKKEFAVQSRNIPERTRSVLFSLWSKLTEGQGHLPEELVLEELKRRVLKNLGSQTKVDGIRSLIGGVKWSDYIAAQDEEHGLA